MVNSQLEQFIRSVNVPLVVRILRAMDFIKTINEAKLNKIDGARLQELCELLAMDIEERIVDIPEDKGKLSKLGSTYFRLLVGQYVRKESFKEGRSGCHV